MVHDGHLALLPLSKWETAVGRGVGVVAVTTAWARQVEAASRSGEKGRKNWEGWGNSSIPGGQAGVDRDGGMGTSSSPITELQGQEQQEPFSEWVAQGGVERQWGRMSVWDGSHWGFSSVPYYVDPSISSRGLLIGYAMTLGELWEGFWWYSQEWDRFSKFHEKIGASWFYLFYVWHLCKGWLHHYWESVRLFRWSSSLESVTMI